VHCVPLALFRFVLPLADVQVGKQGGTGELSMLLVTLVVCAVSQPPDWQDDVFGINLRFSALIAGIK